MRSPLPQKAVIWVHTGELEGGLIFRKNYRYGIQDLRISFHQSRFQDNVDPNSKNSFHLLIEPRPKV